MSVCNRQQGLLNVQEQSVNQIGFSCASKALGSRGEDVGGHDFATLRLYFAAEKMVVRWRKRRNASWQRYMAKSPCSPLVVVSDEEPDLAASGLLRIDHNFNRNHDDHFLTRRRNYYTSLPIYLFEHESAKVASIGRKN